MTGSTLRAEVLRLQTRAFVARDPVTVRFTPWVEEKTPSGGVRRTARRPRPPQRVTFVEPSDSSFRGPDRTVQGEVSRSQWMVVGDETLVVEEGDRFEVAGKRYEVQAVMPANGYETRAVATRLG